MQRILEPELMDDEDQAAAYAGADFSASNQLFVDDLLRAGLSDIGSAIDIGCGPADVVIRLARAAPWLTVTAIDGSASMIALARAAVGAAGLESRIALRQLRIPADALPARTFDAVFAKDMLHHVPDSRVFWREVQRLGRPGAAVHVMDLVRPDSPDAARRIVDTAAAREPQTLKRDFFNSLCASFTVTEVRSQLEAAALPLTVAPVGDRHMMITGRLPRASAGS